MEVTTEKTKLITNRTKLIEKNIKVSGQELETVNQFKYLVHNYSQRRVLFKDQSPSKSSSDSSTGKTETNVERQKHQSTKLKLLHALVQE